jgi:uncharacterized delta-60 repeat protein
LTKWSRTLSVVVVVAGSVVYHQPASAALEASGHPMLTFGGDGAVQTNFALVDTFAEARALGIQSVGSRAGQIVIAGGYQDGFDSHVALLRLNADGTQDSSFGSGGEVKTVVGSNDLAEDIVIQPDDKIVVAGFSDNRAMVLRYLPDGQLDNTFGGGDGVTTFQVITGQQTRVQSVILQPDGKILVAGFGVVTPSIPDPTPNDPPYSTSADRAALVARLDANGNVDTTFGGGDGFATINITTPEPTPGFPDPSPPYVGGSDDADGLALQADGKIVWAGRTINVAGSSCNQQIYADGESLIGRLNANGTPDTTFDGDGHRIVSLGTTSNCPDDSFRNVTIQSDGRIVAVGSANTTMDSATNAKANISVARFNSDGSFDNNFSADGRLATSIASTTGFLSDVADDVVVLADGKIVVGASTDQGGPGPIPGTYISENDFAALRYNADGSLDSSFSGDGIGIYDFSENDTFDAMIVDSSGRPVLAGYSFVVGQFADPLVAVARVATNGALDTTFNSTSTLPGTFFKTLQGGSVDQGAAVVRQGVGLNADKLVVIGSTDTGSQTDVGLVRYGTTGALDTSFSADGKATADDGGRNDAPSAAAVQSDDKVVVVGSSYGTSGAPRATVMRFNANSELDTTFDGDGIATLTVGTNANQWDAVALAADGDILVGGTVSDSAGDWDLFVGRYNSNGSPDTGFNSTGRVRLSLGGNVDQVHAIALQPDGKILVAGSTFINTSAQHFAVVRFNANGSADTTFGGGDGIVITPIGSGTFPRNVITGMAVQADGRIVVAGNGNDGGNSTNNVIRLARYLSNGDLDPTFGSGGVVSTNLGATRFDRAEGLALQRDEKIVVFGHSQELFVTRDDFVIARYNWDDGSIDTTFGDTNSGATILAASAGSDQAAGGVLFPDGSAGIGGTVGSSDVGAARFLGDPAPILPAAPDLSAASDSGQSNTDNITNDSTPTFTGATCNVGETTILEVDSVVTDPLSRQLCRTGTWSVTAANPLTDGVHTINAFSRNGAGDTVDTASVNITIDTVANPPVIALPAEAAVITIPPSPTISGTVDEAIPGAVVEVREGASLVCSGIADAAGAWSCASSLGPGLHTITARQTDVAGNVSADSADRTFTLKVPTVTEVSTDVSPSRYGQEVTFTADVTAVLGTPDGAVEFVIEGGAPQSVVLTAGVANLTVPSGSLGALPVGTHTVVANYLGSVGYLPSADTLDPDQEVIKADTTLTVTVDPEPSKTGQPATINATVAAVAPGAGTATGVVSIAVDGGAPTDVALVGGVASIPGTVLSVGSHDVDATYVGDGNFNGSTGEGTHVVERGSTAVAVTAIPSPSDVGDSTTFTATVTAVAPAVGTPGGTVDFIIDGGVAVPVTIAGGQATFTTSALTGGVHVVQVDYAGNSDWEPSTGTLAGGHTVNQAATTTELSASPTASTFGQQVTFTATVTSAAAVAITGDVQFTVDGTLAQTVAIVGGQATFSTSSLAVGSHLIAADYSGDVNFETSADSIAAFGVAKATSSTVLTGSPNPTVFGEPVTLTATVSSPGGVPDGSVDFALPSGTETVALSAGVAQLVIPAGAVPSLPVGSSSITATYSGSDSFEPSADSLADQEVGQASTITTVTSDPSPSVLGESVLLTIIVEPVAPAGGTPAGQVDISIDGGPTSSVALVGGVATLSTSALGVGDHTVVAGYTGSADYLSSTGSVVHTVARAGTQLGLTASPQPSQPGEPVTFVATVTTAGPGTPSGSVSFSVDGGPGVSVTTVGGVATFIADTLGAGARVVVATYSGDVDYGTSSNSITQQVQQGSTTTNVTVSPTPTVFGEVLTVSIEVRPVAPATSGPIGVVELDIDGVVTELTLDGNQNAQFVTTNLPIGAHSITATYLGDTNYMGSDDSTTHVVDQVPTSVLVTSSPNPSVVGEPVTFTATVSATGSTATPEGTVRFEIDDEVRTVALVAGSATMTIEDFAVGSFTGSAYFEGPASYLPSSLDPIPTHVVDKADSSIALALDPAAPVSGETFSLSATVSAVAPGAGIPTGSVTFVIDGGTPVAVALAGGSAALGGLALAGGEHTVEVHYTGDGSFNATSSTFVRVIGPGATTVSVTSSSPTGVVGQPVTFTATVEYVAPATGDPKGTVEFLIDDNPPITAQLQSPASITVPSLGAGPHSVVVNYLGSGTAAASSGALVGGFTVAPAEVVLTISSSPNPVVQGLPVTIVVTAQTAPAGSVPVSGTVELVIDGAPPIVLTLVNGVATHTSTDLSVGSHSVSARYVGGSGDFVTGGSSVTLPGGLLVVTVPGGLPATGANGAPLGRIAATMLVIGVMLVGASARRRAILRG